MDSNKVMEEVDKKCKEIEDSISEINKTLHGAALKEKLFELTSRMSRLNELLDKATFKVGIQKRKVDLVESISMQSLIKQEKSGETTKIPATLKSYYLENNIVTLDEYEMKQTSLYKEKIELEHLQYVLNRFKSTYELIKTTIMVCQSSLSFDREEMKNISFS